MVKGSTIKILILDNYSIFSDSIRAVLQKEGLIVTGDVRSWDDLSVCLNESTPDVILLNLIHGNNNHLESLKQLKKEYPDIPLLMITSETYSDFFIEYMLIGVSGFILNDTTQSELIRAIRMVAGGEDYFPNQILRKLKDYLSLYRLNPSAMRHMYVLTRREIAVLELICKGMTFKEIAGRLFISPRTVETHKKNILSKLKVKTTADLIQFAIRHQLV